VLEEVLQAFELNACPMSHKEQGKAIMDTYFVIRVVLKAVL